MPSVLSAAGPAKSEGSAKEGGFPPWLKLRRTGRIADLTAKNAKNAARAAATGGMKLSFARKENSPPLQRRVSVQDANQVPSGTKYLSSLTGLAWLGWPGHPAINDSAIFKKSARECRSRSDCSAKNAEPRFGIGICVLCGYQVPHAIAAGGFDNGRSRRRKRSETRGQPPEAGISVFSIFSVCSCSRSFSIPASMSVICGPYTLDCLMHTNCHWAKIAYENGRMVILSQGQSNPIKVNQGKNGGLTE